MTNAELREIVFSKIREFGFKICNVENVDGYFLFEGDKDSVTHFRVKGKGMWKHWKFGLWINTEYMTEEYRAQYEGTDKIPKVIQLFAQHDTWIDKFKPSRSDLLFTLDIEQIMDFIEEKDKDIYNESYTFNELKLMLKMMCKHPFMCYCNYCGEYCGYTDKSFILEYFKYEIKNKWKSIKRKLNIAFWLPYTKLKIKLSEKSKIVDNIILYDFEKENEGWSTNYLYQVRITFSENVIDDDICKWLNHWWKKDKYGNYGYYDCVIEVDSFKQIGKKGRFVMVE